MEKDFDGWNKLKIKLDAVVDFPRPKRRQVWWCVIGLNVGSEQSCSEDFERPVLVLKVFGSMFWGIPITSSDQDNKKKGNPLFYKIEGISYSTSDGRTKKLQGYIALCQLRIFDSRRLKRKLLKLDIDLFDTIEQKVRGLL